MPRGCSCVRTRQGETNIHLGVEQLKSSQYLVENGLGIVDPRGRSGDCFPDALAHQLDVLLQQIRLPAMNEAVEDADEHPGIPALRARLRDRLDAFGTLDVVWLREEVASWIESNPHHLILGDEQAITTRDLISTGVPFVSRFLAEEKHKREVLRQTAAGARRLRGMPPMLTAEQVVSAYWCQSFVSCI